MPSIAGLLCGGSLHLICIGNSEDKASPGYQEGVQLGPGLTPVEGEARAAGEAAGAERAGGEGLQAERAAEDASGAAGAAAEGLREASALPKGGVYTLRDPETGAVVRTGRSNDLAARERAHASDPVLRDYAFHVEYRTNDYAEQRGLEQILYERYPEAMLENGGFNKIRGISPLNPKGPEYMEAAEDYLARLEGG
jgi:hypothetical protein